MKSWDCFDTLVARLFYQPQTIFFEVGKKLNIDNFVQKRTQAEQNSDKTYKGIYKNLPGVDPDIEFETELEHCYGIAENINKVQDGDCIVSDMHFDADQILKILRKCGLKKEVSIYVTPDGKSQGYIWQNLFKKITEHTGDNYYSDVQSAQKFGIKANHYTNSSFNKIENYISNLDKNLACWMRCIRLSCYGDGDFKLYWEDQSNFNLPILALASLELPNKEIVFNYRDCVYWHPIYEAVTGKIARSFISSRRAYKYSNNLLNNYIIKSTKDKVLVDLQGSGRSVIEFFSKLNTNMPETIYLCGPVQPPVRGLCSSVSDAIEKLNCSESGTLLGLTEFGFDFEQCEFSQEVVESQKKSIETAIYYSKYFKIKRNYNLLIELMNIIPGCFSNQKIKFL